MPLLTSKSQLEALSDVQLDYIAAVVGGWIAIFDENGTPINWWPIPWGWFRFQIRRFLFGDPWYVQHFCGNMTNATALANEVGLAVDPSWTARQVVIESIWHFDQNAGA